MSKIIVIGAGISGLSIGQMLQNENEVTILEGAKRPGGLIKCDRVNGNLFHLTGGHVFNTKRKDVLEWFWSYFDKENEFNSAKRNATIAMPNNKFIPYPIENSVHLLDDDIIKSVIYDLLEIEKNQNQAPNNFKEFLLNRFGNTLYEIYFKPYNEKIWRCDLSTIPLTWLEGKLPMPTISEIFFNNIKKSEETSFVHSSFFYPQKDGSQFLVDRFSNGLDIRCNSKVTSVCRIGKKWLINGIEADKVVFCGSIKQIPTLLASQIEISDFIKPIEELEYHGTTTVLCEIEDNPYSWVYLPDKNIQSHRIICTGNFATSNNAEEKMSASIEFTDEITFEAIQKNLEQMPFSPKYLTHHYEQCTYPIQNNSSRKMIASLKESLEKENFYLLGRFAEWEYYNMDVAMGAAIDLCEKSFS